MTQEIKIVVQQTIIILFLIYSCTNKQISNIELADNLVVENFSNVSESISVLNNPLRDTIFIHREVTKDFYHAIYIDPTRNSASYLRLTNFELNKLNKQNFESYLNEINKQNKFLIKKHNLLGLHTEWLPLYKYNQKYYLYAPSDWGNAGRRIINDSTFVYWQMDGLYPNLILSFNQLTDSKYKLIIINPFQPKAQPSELTIYILDPKTKMSVFEFRNETDDYRYQLYVPLEYAAYFDLIVNYCDKTKQLEFNFDKIDFERLINKY